MEKIDRRIAYYMVIDTETVNGVKEDPFMYDLGLAICDKRGRIYEERSLVIADIYCNEKELMKSAYYAEKLPKYEKALATGERELVSIFTAKRIVADLCKKYNVKAITAHNACFDERATRQTIRYVTKSKMRYFLPYGIPLYDTMKMAQDTICKQKSYERFVDKNNLRTKSGRIPSNAQALYCYMADDPTFVEEHQGLDDVRIEVQILARCLAQHKKMRRLAYLPKKPTMFELIASL
jgi:hypothetical protein